MFMFRIWHGNSFSLSIAGGHARILTVPRSCVSYLGAPEMSGLVVPGHTDRTPHSNFSHIAGRAPSSRRRREAASARTGSRVHAPSEPVPTGCPDIDTDRPAPLLVRPPRPSHAPFGDRLASDDRSEEHTSELQSLT